MCVVSYKQYKKIKKPASVYIEMINFKSKHFTCVKNKFDTKCLFKSKNFDIFFFQIKSIDKPNYF